MYGFGVVELTSDITAKGRYVDGAAATESLHESKNFGVIHMEGVIGVDAYSNKPTRLSDNRKNLTIR